MKRVLFVCIGNACRSPMAEGFANYYGKGWLTAFSAGVRPTGVIMPNTIEAMQEKGIGISHQSSKGIAAVNLESMDWVIILDVSLSKLIPVNSDRTQTLNWFVTDPIGQSLDVYRQVRDQIELRVLEFIETVRNRA